MRMIRESTAASLLELDGVYDCIRHALAQQAAGRVEQSDPRSLFLKSEPHNNRYHVKGAYLMDDLVVGFRVREFTHVPARSDEMQLILLSHLETAAFLGLVSSDRISERRFGAMAALSIKTLRASGATSLALIGAGNLARAAVEAIHAATPFESIRVASRSPASRRNLCDDMGAAGITGVAPAHSIEAACDGADVILTITNAEAELIQADWCKPGSLVVSTGGRRECNPDVILNADKVFIDDWDQCVLLGDIAALHREGKFVLEDVTATLGELIAGTHPGRESDDERIVAIPQGLTSLDVALANFVYRVALEKDLGTEVEWP
ncbi:MAG: ornithine cyclodeaminase family protein [Rhodospirillaceae bacterium]|jgi:ornithine cyclodeaminase/alanine dehydrogenase-like protein (mu-crystallin family)|nr:ornithine cyclodeaminase family protein [Rhodospirillaceae bacterium]MBT5456806.1 ornithine cyclodeaminase family protein [Rhodospirillaceae bacterium]